MQQPQMSELIEHLTLVEIRALMEFKAIYYLMGAGFSRTEAGSLVMWKHRVCDHPELMR